jgi:hypothetical protein
MTPFSSTINIIGVNPYVQVPDDVLDEVFQQAQKNKGPIPVKLTLNGHNFLQTLVKYGGRWRLYLNTPMRVATGLGVGDVATVTLSFDPDQRTVPMHPALQKALKKSRKAYQIFAKQSPSLQKEIMRYINSLKTEDSIDRNVNKAIKFLLGKERFIGRNKP